MAHQKIRRKLPLKILLFKLFLKVLIMGILVASCGNKGKLYPPNTPQANTQLTQQNPA